jgi:hypothetical protein
MVDLPVVVSPLPFVIKIGIGRLCREWGSCHFAAEAHRFVAEVVEVGWLLTYFTGLDSFALGR